MKKIITILLFLCSTFCTITNAQTITELPFTERQNPNNSITKVIAHFLSYTIVTIDVSSSLKYRGSWIGISSKTTLNYINPQTQKKESLHIKKILGGETWFDMLLDKKYYFGDFHGEKQKISLIFPGLPLDVRLISIRENLTSESNEFYWENTHINPIISEEFPRRAKSQEEINEFYWENIHINPIISEEFPRLAKSQEEITQLISSSNSSFAGIYEDIDGNGYHLAFIQKDGKNYLLFVEKEQKLNIWKIGEIKATLRQTAAEGVFKCDWYMLDKTKNPNCIIIFEPGIMKVKLDDDETTYIKMALNDDDIISPNSNNQKQWSGTGFALNNGYVVTNYHVAENAKKIEIYGVAKDFTKSYEAEVVGVDKVNDLALLHIKDDTFTGFGTLPYSVKTAMAEVGEDCFVLGYPLTSSMGEEIKLTNGIISSRSGFDGDVALYQISAPVQPGNSGGPLFDKQGNLIGIVCAKHAGAENASYAIKISYLRNLIESVSDMKILPTKNSILNLELKEQVKQITPFVFMIKCSH